MSTRVLVVDDASLFRRVISDALRELPGVEIAGTATNGKTALLQVASLRPDLLTLDIEMPEMDGLAVLSALRHTGARADVIMVSSQTVQGGEMTIRALECGAFDFIAKPEGGSREENLTRIREALRPMILALERRRQIRAQLGVNNAQVSLTKNPPPVGCAASPMRGNARGGPPLVVIGVSTGGPAALAQIVPALPAALGASVFVVQHMPPHFTEALAQRLHSKSALRVTEAQDREVAQANCVYIAPGGRQMKLIATPEGQIAIKITEDAPENACRPSVDYLFRSVALQFPGRSVAVILTGMGSDGVAGMRMLKRGGALTIAQDEASSVVFGMPKEAILAGVVDRVLPLGAIAENIVRAVASLGVHGRA